MPLAAIGVLDLFYSVPLIVAISLVYAATRHERPAPLLRHALRVALSIGGFMLLISLVLLIISWRL